ncbi:MAG TPA: citrate synthase [Thermoanaerobaculia bacterium]|nr:citrate synthase [Thermoanaerobaculia bacterium]
MTTSAPDAKAQEGAAKMRDSLSITDNRTGKAYEVPIKDDTIRALDLRQIKVQPTDFGLMTYDPAFMNTASCKSRITFIDGDKGILNYRGYPIAELAENTTYLETAYLVVHGELPTKTEYEAWTNDITFHTMVHENIKDLMKGFRYDAHPMGMLASTVAALSTFYPEAKEVREAATRRQQIIRLIAKMPTLAAFAYRHSIGWPFSYPDNELSYTANFLQMMYRAVEPKYVANPVLVKALEILFILHADHEQNCSTNAMRAIASSEADPYVSAAGAIGALYGPLHGGANEAVLRMLFEIGSKNNIPAFIKSVKESGGEKRLMGFGHRVYKNYDPRAKVIKQMAEQVFEVTGRNPLLDIALELERIALEDDYFIKKKLYPNVDFYSGLIYQAMKFPVDMFPVLFAIPRMSGWLAQWDEMISDNDQKIARPRQIYLGSGERHFKPFDKR